MAVSHARKRFPPAEMASFLWSAHVVRQRSGNGVGKEWHFALSHNLRPRRPKLATPASGKVLMPLSPFHSVPSFHTPGLGREVLLQQRAHYMRFNPTPSEALLWSALRGRRLGVAFRRQVVMTCCTQSITFDGVAELEVTIYAPEPRIVGDGHT